MTNQNTVAKTQWSDADLKDFCRRAEAMARRWVGRRDLAEDVAQEAVLRLLQYWPDVAQPVAWLRVVIRRLAIAALSDERQQVPLDEVPPLPSRRDPWNAERRLDLTRAIRALNDRQRELIRMRVRGLRHREIADVYGWPVNRVGPELSRAMKRLRTILEQT